MELTLKKKPQAAKAPKLPAKTFINLAQKESQKKNVVTLVAGAAGILAVSLAVAKFGVLDQFARLDAAEANYNQVHEQYVAIQREVEDYPNVEKRYRTYSRKWMEDSQNDGLVTVDRTLILDMMEAYLRTQGTVVSFNIKDTVMVANMSGMNLRQISAMLTQVEAQPIVSAATLNLASTENKDDPDAILDFTLTIALQPIQEETEE